MKLIILSVFLQICVVAAKDPPKWEPLYTVKGVLYIPYAEIEEPFYGWYDKQAGRSRIDYYGGMVKTYQLSGMYSHGTSLKFAPISTNEYKNQETCLQINGTEDYSIPVQSILPDVKNFSLIGSEDYNGVKCDKFQLSEIIGGKKNVYTLWVTYKKSPKYPSSLMPIPVRYDMKGYNTLLGSHIDHYYLTYDYYSHEDIPSEVFDVEINSCIAFPGKF